MFEKIRVDFESLYPGRSANVLKYVEACMTHPGFLACSLFRLQDLVYGAKLRRLSAMIRVLNNALTGADFLPGCRIGPGLVLHHPTGIVIGHQVKIGHNCVILQGVTLGERYSSSNENHEYPHVGNGVTIGAGAQVLGGVVLGDGCKVGANSVVLSDVPAGKIAVGQPAYVL